MTDAQRLARFVTAETGLACDARRGLDSEGEWYLLQPTGVPADNAFAVRTSIRWRRIIVAFEPGRFAGDLLAAMGNADATGRASFRTILRECSRRGAEVLFRVNDEPCDIGQADSWPTRWTRLTLTLNSRVAPEEGLETPEFDAALQWSRLFVAAVLALLPIPSEEPNEGPSAVGFREGAASIHRTTSYERDRRNRAAAIAIWGAHCQACGMAFGTRYGDVANGFIEVHHTTPVSALGADTIVDPATDLVPLCPNCHSVAHRRDPPFSVQEIRAMLSSSG